MFLLFLPDSEYGFAEKVVEGMSVIINSITIKVQARAFHASFELWQLQGNSLNPKWQRSDLRYTRITDPKRGEVTSCHDLRFCFCCCHAWSQLHSWEKSPLIFEFSFFFFFLSCSTSKSNNRLPNRVIRFYFEHYFLLKSVWVQVSPSVLDGRL